MLPMRLLASPLILGGSDELVPCITILIANAINSSKLFAVYSYSLKSFVVEMR